MLSWAFIIMTVLYTVHVELLTTPPLLSSVGRILPDYTDAQYNVGNYMFTI